MRALLGDGKHGGVLEVLIDLPQGTMARVKMYPAFDPPSVAPSYVELQRPMFLVCGCSVDRVSLERLFLEAPTMRPIPAVVQRLGAHMRRP